MKRKLDWDSIVAAFGVSDLTHAEFCKRNRVGLASFRNHLYRARAGRRPSPMFSEIAVREPEVPCHPPVELHFPEGGFLRFPDGIRPADLRAYIMVLRP